MNRLEWKVSKIQDNEKKTKNHDFGSGTGANAIEIPCKISADTPRLYQLLILKWKSRSKFQKITWRFVKRFQIYLL